MRFRPVEVQNHVAVRSELFGILFDESIRSIQIQSRRSQRTNEAPPLKAILDPLDGEIGNLVALIRHAAMADTASKEPERRVAIVNDAVVLVPPIPGGDPFCAQQVVEF